MAGIIKATVKSINGVALKTPTPYAFVAHRVISPKPTGTDSTFLYSKSRKAAFNDEYVVGVTFADLSAAIVLETNSPAGGYVIPAGTIVSKDDVAYTKSYGVPLLKEDLVIASETASGGTLLTVRNHNGTDEKAGLTSTYLLNIDIDTLYLAIEPAV